MKELKIIIGVLASIFTLYSIISTFFVLGDKLLYIDTSLGFILAVTYKWAILISLILIGIWLLIYNISKKAPKNPSL